jgi:hypothetical protein
MRAWPSLREWLNPNKDAAEPQHNKAEAYFVLHP